MRKSTTSTSRIKNKHKAEREAFAASLFGGLKRREFAMEKKFRNIYKCFPGGKHKALTMSYDDGLMEDARLISIFNEYGIKGTFHLNSGLHENRFPLDEIAEIYAGHEVACHTLTHPTIERCPIEQVAKQILLDRENLEKAVGYPVRGLSYPNGSYSQQIKALLPLLGIRYSRVVGSSENFSLPKDPYEWKATCHHGHRLIELGEQFCGLYKRQYLYLMYVWGHSYEFSRDNSWGLIEDFCKLAGKKEDTWYATNIEIMDYLDACDALRYSADGTFVFNPSFLSVWLEVDGKIIEAKGGEKTEL